MPNLIERVVQASETNPSHTEKLSHARMELPKFPLASTCEKLMIKSYDKNTQAGVVIDKQFINDIIASGKVPKVANPARVLTPQYLTEEPWGHATWGKREARMNFSPSFTLYLLLLKKKEINNLSTSQFHFF